MAAHFTTGPVLELPVMDRSMHYPGLRVSDRSGVLGADRGLIVREGGSIQRVVVRLELELKPVFNRARPP